MPYERSFEIERRLQLLLSLIQGGSYSTPALADELGVSIPTVSRDLTALRARGYLITAERRTGGWRYSITTMSKFPPSRYVESTGPLLAVNQSTYSTNRKENRS